MISDKDNQGFQDECWTLRIIALFSPCRVGGWEEVWGNCGGGEGGVGGANLLNLTSCLEGWLVGCETLGEQTGQTGVCVSVCLCFILIGTLQSVPISFRQTIG